MSATLDWIDQQILLHQREISKLEIAKQVLAQMPAKAQPKLEAPKNRRRGVPRSPAPELYADLVAKVAEVPGHTAWQIAENMGLYEDRVQRKRVANALFHLFRSGKVLKDDKKYFPKEQSH